MALQPLYLHHLPLTPSTSRYHIFFYSQSPTSLLLSHISHFFPRSLSLFLFLLKMATKSFILAVYTIMALTMAICSARAYEFHVGGRDGWVLHPKEKYNHWAQRMRFQVTDSLVFKYIEGEDSVMVVAMEDYEACNTTNPIKKMEDGNSVFPFDRSGSFFFISGNHERCQNGEKLWVIVMAVRKAIRPSPSTSPSPSPSPSPSLAPFPPVSPASEQAPINPSSTDETMTPSPSLSTSSSPAMVDHNDVISIMFITILLSSLLVVGWSELSCNIDLGRVFSMLCMLLLDC